jgi:hypothetical protein
MNRQELEQILRADGIRRDAYSLDGGLPPERFCLTSEGGGWVVYYSERGIRSGLMQFGTEAAACQYLLNELRNDPSATQ